MSGRELLKEFKLKSHAAALATVIRRYSMKCEVWILQ
jgi:hypothetical protein